MSANSADDTERAELERGFRKLFEILDRGSERIRKEQQVEDQLRSAEWWKRAVKRVEQC